jgi:hypothetical protein
MSSCLHDWASSPRRRVKGLEVSLSIYMGVVSRWRKRLVSQLGNVSEGTGYGCFPEKGHYWILYGKGANLEGESVMILQNVRNHSLSDTVSHPSSREASTRLLCEPRSLQVTDCSFPWE